MSLQQLGWQPVFQQQLTLEELEHSRVARVVEHHRSGYKLLNEDGETNMKAVYSYNLHNREELNELIEFMQDTYVEKDNGPDLDDLLDGLGISLN